MKVITKNGKSKYIPGGLIVPPKGNKKHWSLVGGVRLRSRLGTNDGLCTMDDVYVWKYGK